MLYVLELFTQDSKCYCNSCSTRMLLRGKCHSLEKHQEQHLWHTVAHCMQTAGEAECFPRPAGIQGKSALSKYGTKITPINSEAQGTLWRQSRRKGIGGEGGAGRMRPQEAWESKERGKYNSDVHTWEVVRAARNSWLMGSPLMISQIILAKQSKSYRAPCAPLSLNSGPATMLNAHCLL